MSAICHVACEVVIRRAHFCSNNTIHHALQADWGLPYALDMCKGYPAGVTLTKEPEHGDLVVFSWAPYGHVAVSGTSCLRRNAADSILCA